MSTGFIKSRLLGWLTLWLAGGFLATGAIAYRSASESIERDYAARSVPAAASLAYAELQSDLQRLSLAGELIAGNGFVGNWLQAGERDREALTQRIADAEKQFGLSGSLVVSQRTQRHYRSGSEQQTSALAPPTASGSPPMATTTYRMAPHPDPNDGQALAIQHERRIVGEPGNSLGGIVTGLTAGHLRRFIERYRTRYGFDIRFVDGNGIIVLGNDAMRHLREIPGLRETAEAILSGSATADRTRYRDDDATVYVDSRPISELGVHLLLTGSDKPSIRPVERALLLNLAIAGGVVGMVWLGVLAAFDRQRRQLIAGPGLDPASGLINRSAYEFVFRQTLLETARSKEHLSLILIEIDDFARIAEAGGPKLGNLILKDIGELAQKTVRDSDPVARWSERQFVVQLRDCPLDKAVAAGERLRQRVASHAFGPDAGQRPPITTSLGVAMLNPEEDGDAFLQRAEQTLNRASANGGNRVEPMLSA